MAAASESLPIVDPAGRGRLVGLVAFAAVLVPLLVASQFEPWILFDAGSLAALGGFVAGFFPPRLDPQFLADTLQAAWVTVAIATAGLTIALLSAIPWALAAMRPLSLSSIGRERMGLLPRAARAALRALLVSVRSIPELVLALLFVRVFGLGPAAGVMAIGIAYGAMLAKVFCDIVESNDGRAAAALLHNGASRLAAFVYGTLPQCQAELSSYLIYRWECAVRASVVMGFVGAGGLGQATDTAMKMMAGNEVATLLLAFMVLVLAADLVSRWVRVRLESRALGAAAALRGAASGDRAGWRDGAFAIFLATLVMASFVSLHLALGELFGPQALADMGRFVLGFFPPDSSSRLLERIARGAAETIAMSLIGTLIAALIGILLALPASRSPGPRRAFSRLLLNFLRSVPELVWAAILVIAVGLGPFAGTCALALHTTGVFGRLFADTLENLPPEPAAALRDNGASAGAIFFYARLPQATPQFLSYILYRWENNIRAATVLGVVGAGGLGQMLYFSLSLFQMRSAASVIVAMIAIVLAVDAASHWMRGRLAR
jgi:phosphonate transport system permease protein